MIVGNVLEGDKQVGPTMSSAERDPVMIRTAHGARLLPSLLPTRYRCQQTRQTTQEEHSAIARQTAEQNSTVQSQEAQYSVVMHSGRSQTSEQSITVQGQETQYSEGMHSGRSQTQERQEHRYYCIVVTCGRPPPNVVMTEMS